MAKTIKQKVRFNSSPNHIYKILMDSKKHTEFTGEKALMTKKVGGRFSAYSGYITGVNVELVAGKRIVQAWRAVDFPAGTYTLVTYELSPKGGGTELTFTQHGVPDNQFKSLSRGWHDHYWSKIKDYLASPLLR